MKSAPRFHLPATAIAIAAATVSLALAGQAQAQTPFNELAGNWSGGGQIRLDNGRTERLSCRAFYSPKEGGAAMGVALRCASSSYKIELRSSLRYAGGRVSGTWEERSYNVGGSVTGRASSGSLNVSFSGGLNGSMSVSYGGASQRVSINAGGGLSSVSVSLSKG